MVEENRANTYAAVDLGSNSFHLLVARKEHGELRFIDRIKEMVRLGGGLDHSGYLEMDTQQRALECLARFGQRLRGIPNENIRAVGTQTFRRMRNANAFLMITENALGCPVDIVAGREEARLVYLGVSQGVADHSDRRLVIDIGGGSTELVVGQGPEPLEMESLQFGCVSTTKWFFGSGKISRRKFNKARRGVMAEIQELQVRYKSLGWETAVGSSGTIKAVVQICSQNEWGGEHISREALDRLIDETLKFSQIKEVKLKGLSQRRHPVFIGGLAVLSACFEVLEIEKLRVSPYALREGVLHDLLGRLEHRDPRDKTVQAFKARYGTEEEQVQRIRAAAMAAYRQIADSDYNVEAMEDLLGWAADLHETGLSVSHSQYQQHSGYLVERSDMAGFSQQEQILLAILVRHHRRPIPSGYAVSLQIRLHEPLRLLLFCLRFACILCRTREDEAIPRFELSRSEHNIQLRVEKGWVMRHPLTMTDLEQERIHLRTIGLYLDIEHSKPGQH